MPLREAGLTLGIIEPRGGCVCGTVASSSTSTRPMLLCTFLPTAKAVGYASKAPTGLALPVNCNIFMPTQTIFSGHQ